jgi:outer membrane protein OmpA-like peptidoglycan-associated protein
MSYANGGEGANNEVDRLGGIDGEAVLHFSWLFDGSKTQGYIEHLAALNVADLAMPRTARVHFTFPGGDDPDLIAQNAEVWLTNLRIAGGGNPALFDELSKKGHVALPGILFDSGSDRIRPESTPALAAVAKMLAEHPELKVTIEGHTDAEGKPAANRVLSEKRATAVQAWLVQKHMVAATRLSPKGFGQEKPVASNATSEGRQANRRVELVKVVSP